MHLKKLVTILTLKKLIDLICIISHSEHREENREKRKFVLISEISVKKKFIKKFKSLLGYEFRKYFFTNNNQQPTTNNQQRTTNNQQRITINE